MGKKIFTILLYEQYNNIDIKVHNQIRKQTPFDFNGRKRVNSKCNVVVRPNKEIPVFRVTRPYLNLLVKPRIFFRYPGKKHNAFQNA